MPTYPLPSLAPTISAAGITAPALVDIQNSLLASFQQIFGSDVSTDVSTQDIELLNIFAAAQNDTNNQIIATAMSFSPQTAVGVGLSQVVKTNGIRRLSPSNSSAPVNIVGVSGTVIVGGLIQDPFGNQWALPTPITIPLAGNIVVTMTAVNPGALNLVSGASTITGSSTLLTILTPTSGWQSATTTAAAVPGAPVESDGALRQRQAQSTTISSVSGRAAIQAAIANLTGVQAVLVYQNDTDAPDNNGIPDHSIAAVVLGGSATAIAAAIASKKAPGTGTFGSTSEVVVDSQGVPNTINFFILGQTPIFATATIQQLQGYVSTTGQTIIAALAYAASNFGIGGNVVYDDMVSAARLSGTAAVTSSGLIQSQLDALRATYKLVSLFIGFAVTPTETVDLTIPFNAEASLPIANVTLVGG